VKVVGLVYVAYFLLALAGMTLRSVPLQLAGTAANFVLAVFLYRLFAPADPRIALTLLPLSFIHCVIQGLGQAQADVGLQRFALLPFAGFLIVLGYLIANSTFAPATLGVLVVLAGLAWLIPVMPGVPTWSTLAVVVFGIVAEGALAIWLLTGPSS
jgi:hypothetical protein